MSEAAAHYGASWPVVHAAFVEHVRVPLSALLPKVLVLGIDETRRGKPIWAQGLDTKRWRLVSDRWHTGFVDATGTGGLLAQVEGRTSSAVIQWLTEQPATWRASITHVTIDLSASYAKAVRDALGPGCHAGGLSFQRDVVELPGGVGIVAINERHRVLFVRQCRHPVRRPLWQIPAGLLDSPRESAEDAAGRELFEEGQVRAAALFTFVDTLTSPGMSDETVRIFLARQLLAVPASQRHVGVHEEVEMEMTWVPMDIAVDRCMAGELENGITVAGLLAARLALTRGIDGPSSATAPWHALKEPE